MVEVKVEKKETEEITEKISNVSIEEKSLVPDSYIRPEEVGKINFVSNLSYNFLIKLDHSRTSQAT